jgi:hypothetical protein
MDKTPDTFKRTSKGSFAGVWHHGHEFYRSAQILKNEHIRDPYYVCLAFAIELYIKSMHTTFESTIKKAPPHAVVDVKLTVHPRSRNHSLTDLFNKLPEAVQEDCQNTYFKLGQRALLDDLDEVSETFVKFRYSYETKFEEGGISLSLGLLEDIALFLDRYSPTVRNECIEERKN